MRLKRKAITYVAKRQSDLAINGFHSYVFFVSLSASFLHYFKTISLEAT